MALPAGFFLPTEHEEKGRRPKEGESTCQDRCGKWRHLWTHLVLAEIHLPQQNALRNLRRSSIIGSSGETFFAGHPFEGQVTWTSWLAYLLFWAKLWLLRSRVCFGRVNVLTPLQVLQAVLFATFASAYGFFYDMHKAAFFLSQKHPTTRDGPVYCSAFLSFRGKKPAVGPAERYTAMPLAIPIPSRPQFLPSSPSRCSAEHASGSPSVSGPPHRQTRFGGARCCSLFFAPSTLARGPRGREVLRCCPEDMSSMKWVALRPILYTHILTNIYIYIYT